MLKRARVLLEKRGFEVKGLAPSASAAQTLAGEAGIESETLQRFLARNAGVAEGRLTDKGERDMRARFEKTVLVVDEGSLASTSQTRDLLKIANTLRMPRVVLVGDEKQLDVVDAGKPFAQLQRAGMSTAVMDEIVRQREPALKEAVEASLAGDVQKAFEKLGANVAEVQADNLAGAAAARWLSLSVEERENTGLMAPSHALRERNKRNCAGETRPRRCDRRTGNERGASGLPRLHQCREMPRGQLRSRRRRRLPQILQASRCRERRRTARGGCRPQSRRRQSCEKRGRRGRLGTGAIGGEDRRSRGLWCRHRGAALRRPPVLDPKRCDARARQ